MSGALDMKRDRKGGEDGEVRGYKAGQRGRQEEQEKDTQEGGKNGRERRASILISGPRESLVGDSEKTRWILIGLSSLQTCVCAREGKRPRDERRPRRRRKDRMWGARRPVRVCHQESFVKKRQSDGGRGSLEWKKREKEKVRRQKSEEGGHPELSGWTERRRKKANEGQTRER